jgi:hypothetical protein
MATAIDITNMILPELYFAKAEAVKLLNTNNVIRVGSGLAVQTTNDISVFIDSVDAKIATFILPP